MGQKVNPLIFRSKNFPYYINTWDNFILTHRNIRNYLNMKIFIKKKKLEFLSIRSSYNSNHYKYNIISSSKLLDVKNKQYMKLFFSKFLERNLLSKIKFEFNFLYLKEPLLSTKFILTYLCNKLLHTNNPLRKIIPQLVLLINRRFKIKGFKCIVSGRIHGAQMAKVETFSFNESSLQDKTLHVKYSCISVPTKYGLLGIKIWLFLK